MLSDHNMLLIKRAALLALAMMLLISCPALANGIKKFGGGGGGGPNIFFQGTTVSSTTAGVATEPMQHAICAHDANVQDALNELEVCWVPIGWTWTVKSVTYRVVGVLGSTERCLLGVSSDNSGAVMAAWSSTPVGDSTTSTCDSESSDGDIDTVGEWCYNSDATGLVISGGNPIYLMIDEVSGFEGGCEKLQAVWYQFEIEAVKD